MKRTVIRYFSTIYVTSVVMFLLFLGCHDSGVGPVEQSRGGVLNQILFVSRTSARAVRSLYSMNNDGTGVRQRVFPPIGTTVNIVTAVWSPDLTRFAVVWEYDGPQRQEYPVMWLADTGGVFLGAAIDTIVQPPVWSPDGSQIAWTFDGINILNVYSGSRRNLINGKDTIYEVYDWSKDGNKLLSRLAVLDNRGVIQRGELWEIALAGQLVRRIFAQDSIVVTYAQWSPDEDEIALVYLKTGDYYTTRATGILLLEDPGSTVTTIAPELRTWADRATYGIGRGLRWSPDGQELGYVSKTNRGEGSTWSKTFIVDKSGMILRVFFDDSSATHEIADWR